MGTANQEWTTIRTFSSTAADSSGLASASDCVGVRGTGAKGLPHMVEFSLSGCSVGGSPTSALIDLYRVTDGVVDFLTTWTISGTDITNAKVTPIIVEAHAGRVYGKVSFSGGTSPTLTGTLRARAVE